MSGVKQAKVENTDSIVKWKDIRHCRELSEKRKDLFTNKYTPIVNVLIMKLQKKNWKPTAAINYHFALLCNCFAYESFFSLHSIILSGFSFQAQHFGSIFLYISFNSVNVAKNKEEKKIKRKINKRSNQFL